MVRFGKVIEVNPVTKTGVIRCVNSHRDFFFTSFECENQELPARFTGVTFIKDSDYKQTDVAMLIKKHSLPRVG